MSARSAAGHGVWTRVGRGRQLDFYATDQEVATRLSEMPQETGRYELIGRLFDDHERAWHAWCAPIPVQPADFVGRGSCQIRSLSLTPIFDIEPAETLGVRAFVEGMPQLTHGVMDRLGRRVETTIVMSPRISKCRHP